MKERGRFLVFEGGTGSGKTTQINFVRQELADWQFYREPGGTPFGEKIREALLGLNDYPVEKYASLFAYTAARANLIRGKIIPELEEGANICLDRYWYSTYAYQGALGVPKVFIWLVSVVATRGLKPDLVIHYDLAPEIGLLRKKGAPDLDRYDVKELEFHQKLRRNYLQLAKLYPGIWQIVDATRPPEEVFEETKKILKKFGLIQ